MESKQLRLFFLVHERRLSRNLRSAMPEKVDLQIKSFEVACLPAVSGTLMEFRLHGFHARQEN
jgi:hypothetical protein